jgi:NADPH2:quinone reductase
VLVNASWPGSSTLALDLDVGCGQKFDRETGLTGGRMRAVWLQEFGGPEVLVAGDAPDPVAGPGQALIEVAFANITFVETQFRASGVGPFTAELPMIPGNGVGGVVAAVGAGVDKGLVGRRVVSSTGGSGGYAERVAVDAGGLIEVPDGVELDRAVALLADGRTAMLLVRAAGLRAGERVLVEAAAGGVGTLLVQLAAAAGARVVAAAGGARKVELARDLGAEVVVDYREPGWTERVRAAVGGADVVFDGVGGDIGRAAFELLDRGGRMLSFGLASGEWAAIPDQAAADRGVTLVRGARGTPEELRALTKRALAEAAAGRLRPVIGQRFPLDQAADAHAAIQARATVGKTLLEVR